MLINTRLNEKVRENYLNPNSKYVGSTLEVLVGNLENYKGKNVITGRIRNNKIVYIPCDTDITGKLLDVKKTQVPKLGICNANYYSRTIEQKYFSGVLLINGGSMCRNTNYSLYRI